jgi:penicillin-binding protein 2
MADRKGAVVASDARTGEILALVSSPSFDPEQVEEYLDNKGLPLFNRAVSGEYPPGSVFKVVTATAALEEGKVNELTEIEDTGEIRVGVWRFGNWYYDQYGRKEGVLRIVRAIARSNDIFFYKLGEWLGIELLSDWAKYFGLASLTGIDLAGEAYGLMPTPAWKEEYKGEQWYLGDTYITAIGQGDILMTPLQVNQMVGIIASRGRLCQPMVVAREPEPNRQDNCQRLDISDRTLETVIEGMRQVCEAGGTAWPLFEFKVKGKRIEVAGKTGTAEFGDPEDKTHAWFSGFAPVTEPEIVVTVLLEAAGDGSDEAAPVAKELLRYWFSRQ